jgi:aminoglycoside/choline kinase family phosphotransferase
MIELNLTKVYNFLASQNILQLKISKVAGDASFRSYYRVLNGDKSYILMFAPVGYEDPKPFIKIATFLQENNFFAPKVFAYQPQDGFLLLQDFGDISFNKALQQNPSLELSLYQKACLVLINLQKITTKPQILSYNNYVLLKEAWLFLDWYLPWQNKQASILQKAFYKNELLKLFDKLNKQNQCLVLRDYHVDNLMLFNYNNSQEVGLLDFQDALIGSVAYDLVSLLEDARRDVDKQNKITLYQYFLEQSGYDKNSFNADYQVLSLQRNLKILGIFARLAIRDNKQQYLQFIPRVKNLVINRLAENDFFNKQLAWQILEWL